MEALFQKLINYYAATLNSTFYQLYREFISFSSLGDGVTKTPVYEVKLIPVIKDVILLKEVNAFWEKYRSKNSERIHEKLLGNGRWKNWYT